MISQWVWVLAILACEVTRSMVKVNVCVKTLSEDEVLDDFIP